MRGLPFVEEILLVLFNAHDAATPFTLPGAGDPDRWHRLIDTADWPLDPDPMVPDPEFAGGTAYPLQGRSVAVFRLERAPRPAVAIPRARARPRRRASDAHHP
jgi:pullulanase/glycogen debranching enzyme